MEASLCADRSDSSCWQLLTSLIVACGAATPTAVPTAASTVASTAAAARSTVPSAGSTVPAAGASASASVSAPPAFIDGTIQSLTADRVTLTDGQSFAVTPRTSYVKQAVAQASDLVPGIYIGIKGKKQADGTLLATLIDISGRRARATSSRCSAAT